MARTLCRRCGGRGVLVVSREVSQSRGDSTGAEVELEAEPTVGPTWKCSRCGLRWGGMPLSAESLLAEIANAAAVDASWLLEELDDRYVPQRPNEPLPVRTGRECSDLPLRGQYVLGDPGLVVVSLRSDGIAEIDEYVVEGGLPGPMSLCRRGEPMVLPSLRDVTDLADRTRMFVRLVKDSGRRRAARFIRCSECKRRVPPEEADVGWCHSCMTASGVVF